MLKHGTPPTAAGSYGTPSIAERGRGATALEGSAHQKVTLSVLIPCYNEERTLEACIESALAIKDDTLALELIVVDDCSTDGSLAVARSLQERIPELVIVRHDKNMGKGAAVRSGVGRATGEFVAIQDADLEYDPMDLKRLLVPLRNGHADVVIGSRFLSSGYHRVLYFWHSVGSGCLQAPATPSAPPHCARIQRMPDEPRGRRDEGLLHQQCRHDANRRIDRQARRRHADGDRVEQRTAGRIDAASVLG
jgi:glycosyltransferase involved in cell wall biosynthesis